MSSQDILDKPLSRHHYVHERRVQMLNEMSVTDWMTPMEIGGSDGSYHSQDLQFMAKKRLVELKENYSLAGIRSANLYRLTNLGWEYING